MKCRLKCFFLITETGVDVALYFCIRFISYPRTETNMFPKSLDLRPLVQNQTVDENWGGMIEIVFFFTCKLVNNAKLISLKFRYLSSREIGSLQY